jgi:hypothetical protein
MVHHRYDAAAGTTPPAASWPKPGLPVCWSGCPVSPGRFRLPIDQADRAVDAADSIGAGRQMM